MIFVDTSFFFAILSERDPDHTRALEVYESLADRRLPDLLLTTNHVVFETITLAQAKGGHGLAVRAGEILYSEKTARIYSATIKDEKAAFAYLARHSDKGYSAVDCLGFVVMDKLGIREALAVDKHFAHRFIVRPGPR